MEAPPLDEEEEEDEDKELVEVMEDVELEREWRMCLAGGTVSLSGELGQEFCGDVGGVGRIIGGRSAGVSCMTFASGEIGTPAHSPSDRTTRVVWGTMFDGYGGGGRCIVWKSKGLSISTSAEGGGVACPWLCTTVTLAAGTC